MHIYILLCDSRVWLSQEAKGIIGQTNGMQNSNELAPVQDSEACTTAYVMWHLPTILKRIYWIKKSFTIFKNFMFCEN